MNTNIPKPDHVTLGVGDGSGQHFVHGEYDTIKLLQGKLLRLEKAESELAAAKESIKELLPIAEDHRLMIFMGPFRKDKRQITTNIIDMIDRAKALLHKK